jgi:hypothetical protein
VHAATAADRSRLRELLGPHYERQASRVQTLLSRAPTLRAGGEDALIDLVAVLLDLLDEPLPVARERVRAGLREGLDASLAAYAACFDAGLRRLPTYQGAVLAGARTGDWIGDRIGAETYRAGAIVTEPAHLSALTAADARMPTRLEYVIWSLAARRITGLDPAWPDPEVVFPPATRFAVLGTQPPRGAEAPARVFLRELPAGRRAAESPGTDPLDAERVRVTTARLCAWAAARDAVADELRRPPSRPERFLHTLSAPDG